MTQERAAARLRHGRASLPAHAGPTGASAGHGEPRAAAVSVPVSESAVGAAGVTGGAQAAAEAALAATASKAADENFPVALRLLPRRYRLHLQAVYGFARTVDDIGDLAPPAERLGMLADLEDDVRRLYAQAESRTGAPAHAAVRALAATVADCKLPMQPLLDLIEANRQDQVVTRYETFDDLLAYCRLSANPVGRIVLYVFDCFDARRAELSDAVCTGLQLTEHWQDVAEDMQAGRIYLPAEDMRRHRCEEADLTAPHAAPRLRSLLAFEVDRARAVIDSGAPLIGTLRGAARVAVAGYVAGGRAALAAIAAADYDVLAATPRPAKRRVAAELVAAYARVR
jgi:squalene synthase HpnC